MLVHCRTVLGISHLVNFSPYEWSPFLGILLLTEKLLSSKNYTYLVEWAVWCWWLTQVFKWNSWFLKFYSTTTQYFTEEDITFHHVRLWCLLAECFTKTWSAHCSSVASLAPLCGRAALWWGGKTIPECRPFFGNLTPTPVLPGKNTHFCAGKHIFGNFWDFDDIARILSENRWTISVIFGLSTENGLLGRHWSGAYVTRFAVTSVS